MFLHQPIRALLVACLALSATLTWAQPTYPDKTVRMVVPYPPSGGADILARAIGQKLTTAWGQSVVIENKAGAGGSIGTDQVSKAPADGYTLLMASPSHAINGALYKNLSFDPEKTSRVSSLQPQDHWSWSSIVQVRSTQYKNLLHWHALSLVQLTTPQRVWVVHPTSRASYSP